MNAFAALRKMRKLDRMAVSLELAKRKMKKNRKLSVQALKRYVLSTSTEEHMHHLSNPNTNSNIITKTRIVNIDSNSTGLSPFYMLFCSISHV